MGNFMIWLALVGALLAQAASPTLPAKAADVGTWDAAIVRRAAAHHSGAGAVGPRLDGRLSGARDVGQPALCFAAGLRRGKCPSADDLRLPVSPDIRWMGGQLRAAV